MAPSFLTVSATEHVASPQQELPSRVIVAPALFTSFPPTEHDPRTRSDPSLNRLPVKLVPSMTVLPRTVVPAGSSQGVQLQGHAAPSSAFVSDTIPFGLILQPAN